MIAVPIAMGGVVLIFAGNLEGRESAEETVAGDDTCPGNLVSTPFLVSQYTPACNFFTSTIYIFFQLT